jgi:HAD superfamily hydrolase (TIGR01549 family)
MKYSTVLLDWDGCLADTLTLWMNSYLKTYRYYGLLITQSDVMSKSWGNCELGPKNFKINEYEKCWKDIVNMVKQEIIQVQLYRYTKELLINLKKSKYNIAVVTSSEKSIITPALTHHNLNQYIDFLITEEDVKKPKPDPEMLIKSIDFFGVNEKNCLMIGDSAKDIYAAQNAHIDSALILHKSNKQYYDFIKLKQLNSTYYFEDLKKLNDFLNS